MTRAFRLADEAGRLPELVVAYTLREDSIGIISARPANSQERSHHEDEPAP